MPGGGPKYEAAERQPPPADSLLGDARKERIDEVVRRRTRSLAIVLDRLEDAFNMAAVLRTCEAMGIQEVHVIEHPFAKFSPNEKVTQGCEKWLDVRIHPDFAACREHLKSREYAIWASSIRPGATPLHEMSFKGPLALVFGNERSGVCGEALAAADGVFWIPMRGFSQSLNISVAVAATLTRAIDWRRERFGEEGDLPESERRALTERFQKLAVKQRGRIYKAEDP